MLWGLALAAVPIIIHLLFRRRFRRIDWAPMHYLKLSIQRNRRRVRLEQLLLLLLRTAIVLLLFFLVARPVMHAAGIGGWLAAQPHQPVDPARRFAQHGLPRRRPLGLGTAQAWRSNCSRRSAPRTASRWCWPRRPKAPLLREVELANPDETAQLIARQHPAETFTSWGPSSWRSTSCLTRARIRFAK